MGSVIQQHIAQSAFLQDPQDAVEWPFLTYSTSFPDPEAMQSSALCTSLDTLLPPPPPPPPLPSAASGAPAVLLLSEAIAPPELGSAELPSIGSLLHHKGECK